MIPARSGSKGIPDKNIFKLNKKPLLAYSISTAKQSRYINRVVVTTDSKKYAEICQTYEAEVPFVRPKEISQDDIHAVFPVIHCVEWLQKNENYNPDIIVMLLPTSPLRQTLHVDQAIELYLKHKNGSVISLTEAEKPPQYIRTIRNGLLHPYEVTNNSPNFQRQELENYYQLNGSIYVTSKETLLKHKTFHVNDIYPYIMDREHSIDINSHFDLKIAEALLKETSL